MRLRFYLYALIALSFAIVATGCNRMGAFRSSSNTGSFEVVIPQGFKGSALVIEDATRPMKWDAVNRIEVKDGEVLVPVGFIGRKPGGIAVEGYSITQLTEGNGSVLVRGDESNSYVKFVVRSGPGESAKNGQDINAYLEVRRP